MAGGGFATGSDFGTIVVRNRTTTPCGVRGLVRFTAYYANGVRDHNAEANRLTQPIDVVLPPKKSAYHDGDNFAGYLTAELQGFERDDPAQPDGVCRERDKAPPATLVLRIGDMTFTVANNDPGSTDSHRVYGCHGKLLLANVQVAE